MSDLKICNNCGATIEDEQDFCPKCGTRVGMSKCEKCGAEFEGESKI